MTVIQAWERLAALLSEPDVLRAARRDPRTRSDVNRCWREIEAHSDLRAATFYEPLFDMLEEEGDVAFDASILLWELGHLDSAFETLQKQFLFYNLPSAMRTASLAAAAAGLPVERNPFLERNMAVHGLLGHLRYRSPSREPANRADLEKEYAALVTVTDPHAGASDFRQPFVGHLPGYLATSEAAGADPPDEKVYLKLLMQRWRALLDSPASARATVLDLIDELLLHSAYVFARIVDEAER